MSLIDYPNVQMETKIFKIEDEINRLLGRNLNYRESNELDEICSNLEVLASINIIMIPLDNYLHLLHYP